MEIVLKTLDFDRIRNAVCEASAAISRMLGPGTHLNISGVWDDSESLETGLSHAGWQTVPPRRSRLGKFSLSVGELTAEVDSQNAGADDIQFLLKPGWNDVDRPTELEIQFYLSADSHETGEGPKVNIKVVAAEVIGVELAGIIESGAALDESHVREIVLEALVGEGVVVEP